MERDAILTQMNQLHKWLGAIDEQIQQQANRESISAWANYPTGSSDPQLTKVKDQLVELSIKVTNRLQALHDALVATHDQ